MSVITRDNCKTLLGITNTNQDALIDLLIPMVEDEIKEECNFQFLDVDGNENWPLGVTLIASKMVGYRLNDSQTIGMKSESQGGYSYTKEEMGRGGYPDSIIAGLAKYRRVSTVFSSKIQQFRDRRGMSVDSIAKGENYSGQEGFKR